MAHFPAATTAAIIPPIPHAPLGPKLGVGQRRNKRTRKIVCLGQYKISISHSSIRKKFGIWKQNYRIRTIQPLNVRGKILILAFGPRGLRPRGKVESRRFFPPFCRVLGQCGIASAYVGDYESLERALCLADGLPTVLVNLLNEDFDDLESYKIPNDLLQNVTRGL